MSGLSRPSITLHGLALMGTPDVAQALSESLDGLPTRGDQEFVPRATARCGIQFDLEPEEGESLGQVHNARFLRGKAESPLC